MKKLFPLLLSILIISCNGQIKTQPMEIVRNDIPNATASQVALTDNQETDQFINRLIADQLVDEAKGFTVIKNQNLLYINGQQQTAMVAEKYLSMIKQEGITVTVHPFIERLIKHPDASMMQILEPIKYSSPCVDKPKKKPGC